MPAKTGGKKSSRNKPAAARYKGENRVEKNKARKIEKQEKLQQKKQLKKTKKKI